MTTTRARISSSRSIPQKPDIAALQQVAAETGFDRSTKNANKPVSTPKQVERENSAKVQEPTVTRGRRRNKRAPRTENLSHRVTASTINNLMVIADSLSEEQNRDVPLVEALELAIAQTAARMEHQVFS